jgi:uncharacterized protein YndB with AHSA1/START domain
MSNHNTAEDAVVIERVVAAPIELVWQLWTVAAHFRNWYGPQGFTIPVAEMDVRVGGRRLICMAAPNGQMQMWFTGEYREVSPTSRLVYTESMADEEGNILDPAAMGMPPGTPKTTEITVLLEALGGKTKMVMTHAGVPAGSPGALGWQQAFAKLADYVETLRGD